jgi:predicted metal-binding protein
MDREALKTIALDTGFSHVGILDATGLQPREDVRGMCAVNKCGAYGANWSCPPACGTLKECAARLRSFTRGLVLQTTGRLEDSFDYEGIERLQQEHAEYITAFAQKIRPLMPGALLLGAGACRRCPVCAYPAPCRFPDEKQSSMEAYCLVVSDVCRESGLPYYYGPGTLTFVGCVLFNAPLVDPDPDPSLMSTARGPEEHV